MLDIFGRVLGTKKAVNDVFDKDGGHLAKVGEWIGNQQYTDEEKAEANKETRQWAVEYLKALAPFKVVQRILAFSTAFFWIFVGINVVFAIWVESVTRHPVMFEGQQIWMSVDAKTPLLEFAFSDYVFWPVIAVFSLYFLGGVWPDRKK